MDPKQSGSNNVENPDQLSGQDFRDLAESLPQIVWMPRADGWNIYFSRKWVEYTGPLLEMSYGHGWNKPGHPDDQQGAWVAWLNATNHRATCTLECRLRRRDGSYRWWQPVDGEKLAQAIPELRRR